MPSRQTKWHLVVFLVLPLLLFCVSNHTIQKLSFNWFGGDYDPSYAYLLNSLSNACLKQAAHVDHPGTPAQVFGAVVLRAAHLFDFRTKNDLQTDVLADPEHYLFIITMCCLFITCIFLTLMGYITFRLTKNIWLGIAIQLSPFYSEMILFHGMLRFSQEIFLMISVFSMVIAVIAYIYKNGEAHPFKYNLIFGIISAFGLTNKIVFFPLLIIPFFILRGLKNKIYFLIFTVTGFVLFTLPVINRYRVMFGWFTALFMHSGIYGSGKTGVIDQHLFLANLKNMLEANLVFTWIIIFSIVVILIILLLKNSFPVLKSTRKYIFTLLLVIISEFTGILVTAKHPSPRYLMPYEALMGFNIFLLLAAFKEFYPVKLSSGKYMIPAIVIIIMIIIPQNGIKKINAIKTDEHQNEFIITNKIFSSLDTGYIKLYCVPSASPEAGLYFGSVFSDGQHVKVLKKLYPDIYFVNNENFDVMNWNGYRLDIKGLLSEKNKRIVILNYNLREPFDTNAINFLAQNKLTLKSLYSGECQSIYQLKKVKVICNN